jgi:hypothetical protein
MGKAILIGVSAYLALGAGVTVWTIIRQQNSQPSFDGLGTTTEPAAIVAQNVLLWPYAVFVNLTKKGATS